MITNGYFNEPMLEGWALYQNHINIHERNNNNLKNEKLEKFFKLMILTKFTLIK